MQRSRRLPSASAHERVGRDQRRRPRGPRRLLHRPRSRRPGVASGQLRQLGHGADVLREAGRRLPTEAEWELAPQARRPRASPSGSPIGARRSTGGAGDRPDRTGRGRRARRPRSARPRRRPHPLRRDPGDAKPRDRLPLRRAVSLRFWRAASTPTLERTNMGPMSTAARAHRTLSVAVGHRVADGLRDR